MSTTEPEAAATTAGYVISHKDGRIEKFLAVAFFWAAVGTYIYAEGSWSDATKDAQSIGVGTSAYHTVAFVRSLAFAGLLIAAGVVSLLKRSYTMT